MNSKLSNKPPLHFFVPGHPTLTVVSYSSPNYRFVDVDKLEYDGDGSRSLIRRLRKFTKYEIVIQAVNTFGEGPLSIPSIGQTKEDGMKI